MVKHIVLYSADLHGNEVQYQKLIDYAIKNSVDSVIIGGDIAPKEHSDKYLEIQRDFIQTKLTKLARELKEKLPKSNLLLMMGNDDCAANFDALEKNSLNLYKIIQNRRIEISKRFDIVGYSYVPITPFGLKDWEKYDLRNISENLKEEKEKGTTLWRLNGYKTDKWGWHEFSFTSEMAGADSIQKDLGGELFTKNPKKTIYVFHSPPNKTNLDKIRGNISVGSLAIRRFIEERQPYATLHGHIHETVDISKSFRDQIGGTQCFSPGNNNIGEKLAVLVFNLYDLNSIERLML